MHLVLFFTHDTSLRAWERSGMLEREVALYRKYVEKGVRVSFITYGRRDKQRYSEKLRGIEILCNEFRLPLGLYTRLIPLLHGKVLRQSSVIKSNQTPGALTALAAARRFNKPMLARCGYMHSEFIANQHGADSPQARQALGDELKLFGEADAIEVTTPMMRDSIAERIPGSTAKITVTPNYVDTETFSPRAAEKEIDLLFIGRLNPQKNLESLLEALRGLELKTLIIGSGPLENELKEKARALDLDIDWKGNLPNTELPGYLNRSKIFILPSHYEGHPKTLIEAMAAGAAVIGANAPGIREVIAHDKNGWLCETSPDSIRAAITALTGSEQLRTQLGANARAFALAHYSLDIIAERELALLETLRCCKSSRNK
ncbi:glycosyltransferase family 4 protein [Chlorobaculum thiosulfatiphilum]|uniref:Glycosyltransferase family 4 protein n=1 Tax=Chlorobaculum thiosulfatiphilum TaxID=115852 RepID=A0A5C4S250_CHLTI|nr:glycosyltransferase family 4 protein [Chlorobaculum thiosulfatiphilum]TNJ37583.1 glycosyltransferase family 4 protein [Chlorobaculum thiosulfatiphilum]